MRLCLRNNKGLARKDGISFRNCSHLESLFLVARAFSSNHPTTSNYTLARVTLPASGTLHPTNTAIIQGTQATIDPKLVMNTNNMADQNTFLPVNTQNDHGGGDAQDAIPDFSRELTQEEIDAFLEANSALAAEAAELNFGDGFMDVPMDVPMDNLFADNQQGQAMQPPSSDLPPNTKGPYYDPETQWHVKSTLHMATPLPPQTDPNFKGPFFAPEVGWYYKMLNPPGTQQVAPMPFAVPQEGYTPAPATPYSSAMPSGMTTPLAPPDYRPAPTTFTPGVAPTVPHTRPTHKPKYGPAAYLSKNAGGSVSTPPRSVSISEAQYTSAARKRDTRTAETVPTPHGGRKRKNPSIIQACICSEKRAQKVKRPRNAFILYRSSRKDHIMKQLGSRDNQHVSKSAAAMWKNETEAVRKQYQDLALQEAARHREEHPDYKYQPGLAERMKFGSASCTCGAYRINMNALIAKRGSVVLADFADDEDEGGEESDACVPPRSYRARGKQPQMPTAPYMMQAPPTIQAPFLDPSTFGSVPWQQGQAGAQVGQPRRKRAADQMLEQAGDEDEGHDPPLVKRRRRSPNISYAEVGDEEIEDDVFADLVSQPQPGTYSMPNPMNRPPAANTRAQSRARNSLSPPGNAMGDDFDFGAFMQPSPIFDFNADMFENIDVAPRPVTSGSQDNQSHPYSLRPRGGSKSPPRQ